MAHISQYRDKLVSADEAVRVVKSGDWIDIGTINAQVVALDKALAKRKDELEDVKVWSLLSLRPPEIMQGDSKETPFVWNSWHCRPWTENWPAPAYRYIILRCATQNCLVTCGSTLNLLMWLPLMQVGPMDKHGWFKFLGRKILIPKPSVIEPKS